MNAVWYIAVDGVRSGPHALDELRAGLASGALRVHDLVWSQGMTAWTRAEAVAELAAALPRATGEPPELPRAPDAKSRGLLHGIGARLSDAADLPTISDVPVREILFGGLGADAAARRESPEDVFAAGVERTTPALEQIVCTWPRPRAFWRILLGSLAAYVLLVAGVKSFANPLFVPGLIVVGSFAVPLALVVLFMELNVARNVSSYAVGKLVLVGGVLSLIATMLLANLLPSGVGALGPALMTGVVEEVAKLAALLLVVRETRFKWQLNGLLLGAAVGAGFAGFESAGYAMFASNLGAGVLEMIHLRGLLAPGGHVIWCALVGAALWKVKGEREFQLGMLCAPVVLRRLAIAVLLHGLWDTDVGRYVPHADFAPFGVPLFHVGLIATGWYLVFGVLKQSLAEIAAAKARAIAPIPA